MLTVKDEGIGRTWHFVFFQGHVGFRFGVHTVLVDGADPG